MSVLRSLLPCLGLLAGVILPALLDAQVGRDTVVVADTLPPDARPDTVPLVRDPAVTPFVGAELPASIGIAEENRWHRPHFLGTGAVTLLDLLERIPGVTGFHTGWIASPMHAAYLGSTARVRVFLDGVELVPMDPELGIVADLHDVPLWMLEDVSIERGADELRVHAQSWRVARTDVFTRTDFETGDANTNLYRAYVGRRWRNGAGLQASLEQYATSPPPARGGGGDQLTIGVAGGWARGQWSADALALDARRARDAQPRLIGTGGMPRFRANRRTSYARLAYGHPERSDGWAQLLAVSRSFRPERPQIAGAEEPIPDTTRWDAQFVAAGGVRLGDLRLSATNRFHVLDGASLNALEGRLRYGTGPLSAGLRAERRGGGLSSVEEATIALAPFGFVGLSAAAARRTPGTDATEASDLVTARGEASVRLGRLWLSGGVVHRGEALVPGLQVFDTAYIAAVDPATTGITASARGRIWREVGVSVWMLRWEDAGWYRPQLQVRSELFVRTMWLSRFPRGNLEIFVSAAVEHRSAVFFPRAAPEDLFEASDVAPPLEYLITRLEVRLLDAVLFWQQRLALTAVPELVPGYVPIEGISFFGVRWNFWN